MSDHRERFCRNCGSPLHHEDDCPQFRPVMAPTIARCGCCGTEHVCGGRQRRVIIESPLAGDFEKNLAYARAAMRDCLDRGEAPYASHLLYPQVYDDNLPAHRERGITAGLAWGEAADATVVYTDLGISPGMQKGIEHAEEARRIIEYRTIPGWKP